MNSKLDTTIREKETRMELLSAELNSLDLGERDHGQPATYPPVTNLIRGGILRKQIEILELELAQLNTQNDTGEYPDHFDDQISQLQKEIEKDRQELKQAE